MAIQIALGGAATEAGQAFGSEFLGGFKAGEKQQKQDAAAQELIQATQASYGAELERADQAIPDIDPGTATMVQTGLPGPLGTIPVYMAPRPNEDQVELDGLSERYAQGIKSFTNPEAARVYTQAAAQSLDTLHSGITSRGLTNSMNAAVSSGAVTDQEAAVFLEDLAAGTDPREVRQAWQAFANDKIDTAKHVARAERMVLGINESENSFLTRAADRDNAEEAAWLNEQAGKLSDLAVEASESARFGIDDFDAEAVWEQYQEIKYALNPQQKQRADLETVKLKGLYSALNIAVKEGDEETIARLQFAIDGIGPAPTQIPAGIANPNLDPRRVSPATPGPAPQAAPAPPGADFSAPPSEAPPEKPTGRFPIQGRDPFKAVSLPDLADEFNIGLGQAMQALTGETSFTSGSDAEMVDQVMAALEAFEAEDPRKAKLFQSRLLAYVQEYEKKVAAREKLNIKDTRTIKEQFGGVRN